MYGCCFTGSLRRSLLHVCPLSSRKKPTLPRFGRRQPRSSGKTISTHGVFKARPPESLIAHLAIAAGARRPRREVPANVCL